MKKKLLIVFVSLFFSGKIFSQIVFQKIYTGLIYASVMDIQQTSDSGYVILGGSLNLSTHENIFIVRTNKYGDTLWSKMYDGYDGEGCSIRCTADGGYIISGHMTYNNTYLVLLKIDAAGSLLWNKYYHFSLSEFGYSLAETFDGGYIISCVLENGGRNTILVKTDSLGNLQFSKYIGDSLMDGQVGYHIEQTSDSGYIIGGYMSHSVSGTEDMYLIKTDALANIIWTKEYDAGHFDMGFFVKQTHDGGYAFVGTNSTTDFSGWDVLLLKTDSVGNLLWSKTYGGSGHDYGYSLSLTNDGGFLIGGSTNSFGLDSNYIYIIKTDSSGVLQWSKVYHDASTFDGLDFPYRTETAPIQQTFDGGFAIAATTVINLNQLDQRIHFVKTDSFGNSFCNVINVPTSVSSIPIQTWNGDSVTYPATAIPLNIVMTTDAGVFVSDACSGSSINELKKLSLQLSPNPTASLLNIQTTQSIDHIELFNLLGKQVGSWHPEMFRANGNNEITIDLTQLSPGIYILQAGDGEKVWRGKVVKE